MYMDVGAIVYSPASSIAPKNRLEIRAATYDRKFKSPI